MMSGGGGVKREHIYRHWQVSKCSISMKWRVPYGSVGATQPTRVSVSAAQPIFPVQAQPSRPCLRVTEGSYFIISFRFSSLCSVIQWKHKKWFLILINGKLRTGPFNKSVL